MRSRTGETPAAAGRLTPGRLILVTGGASSGKSARAEELAVRLREERCGEAALWYAATMRSDPRDEETRQRIGRHRRQRAGKGFRTVEREREIGALSEVVSPGDVILLEDLPNLLANELFPPAEEALLQRRDSDERDTENRPGEAERLHARLRERITGPLLAMRERGITVVAVTGALTEEVSGDWDEGTRRYVEALQRIGCELGRSADQVIEVVCGIPLVCGMTCG